jgi:hypothetical protein
MGWTEMAHQFTSVSLVVIVNSQIINNETKADM